ncbi:MAG: CBS domain-containing protein [Aliarcobacter sp.]
MLQKVMLDFKLHAIPIVAENDILIGIVTKTDILKAITL